LAPAAVSEQLGASSIRVSMAGKDNPGVRARRLLFGKRGQKLVRYLARTGFGRIRKYA
jgi:hypothetical protein